MSSAGTLEKSLYSFGPVRRLAQWLDAMPHPSLVCEISPTHVAAAHWGHRRLSLDSYSTEALPDGAVSPSAVETNITNAEAVRSALRRVLNRVPAQAQDIALLVPDPVVRVFILPFETFPRRTEESLPLLRWRLKKSVPFDVEETVVSAMRQDGRDGSLEVVAALARQHILREYEAIVEGCGLTVGVALSSTLAALSLLEEDGATLLARISGRSLTTAIVQGDTLCVYRTTEMNAGASQLSVRSLLDEIFPAVAFYQDTWGAAVSRVRLAGFGDRFGELRPAVGAELGCTVLPFTLDVVAGDAPADVQDLMKHQLDALVGWTLNGRM